MAANVAANLKGHLLIKQDKSEKSGDEILSENKLICFYFSAHWCPPCRGFTPKLAEWYKKDLQAKGMEVVFASSDNKVGLAVGITEKLISKYDAVKFAKLGSETIGGKGGGGRKDFAQAGGQDQNKIDEAFEKIKALI